MQECNCRRFNHSLALYTLISFLYTESYIVLLVIIFHCISIIYFQVINYSD